MQCNPNNNNNNAAMPNTTFNPTGRRVETPPRPAWMKKGWRPVNGVITSMDIIGCNAIAQYENKRRLNKRIGVGDRHMMTRDQFIDYLIEATRGPRVFPKKKSCRKKNNIKKKKKKDAAASAEDDDHGSADADAAKNKRKREGDDENHKKKKKNKKRKNAEEEGGEGEKQNKKRKKNKSKN